MDELIKKVMLVFGIDKHFIDNKEVYRVLKNSIRSRIRDVYKISHDDSPKTYTDEQLKEFIKNQNKALLNINDIVTERDARMISFYKKKMKNPAEWKKIIEQIKSDTPISERKLSVKADINKLYIVYQSPDEEENILTFYRESTGNIHLIRTTEKNNNMLIIEERINQYGEKYNVKFKDVKQPLKKTKIKKKIEERYHSAKDGNMIMTPTFDFLDDENALNITFDDNNR